MRIHEQLGASERAATITLLTALTASAVSGCALMDRETDEAAVTPGTYFDMYMPVNHYRKLDEIAKRNAADIIQDLNVIKETDEKIVGTFENKGCAGSTKVVAKASAGGMVVKITKSFEKTVLAFSTPFDAASSYGTDFEGMLEYDSTHLQRIRHTSQPYELDLAVKNPSDIPDAGEMMNVVYSDTIVVDGERVTDIPTPESVWPLSYDATAHQRGCF